MKSVSKTHDKIITPKLSLGCRGIDNISFKKAEKLLKTCYNLGNNFFDFADVHCNRECESIFSKIFKMKSCDRENYILQSKCIIRSGVAGDYTKGHIIKTVDNILKRFRTDYLDILLLNRLGPLVSPEGIVDAFDILNKNGKVRNFGVINHTSSQMALLQMYLDQVDIKILFNQIHLTLAYCHMIDIEIHSSIGGQNQDQYKDIIDYCRMNKITIQALSPFELGFFEDVFINNDQFPELNKCFKQLSQKYNVSNLGIAMAWARKHPAKIQTIVNTADLDILNEMNRVCSIDLSLEEWYAIYTSANRILP